jgi:exonuclease III
MKIATYNVNNINKRFEPLAAWLKRARPEGLPPRIEM